MSTIYYWLGLALFWAFVAIISTIVGVLSIERLTRRNGLPYSIYEWNFRRKRLARKYVEWFNDKESRLNTWAWDFGQYCYYWRQGLSLKPRRYRELWWPWACRIYMENRCGKYPEWSGKVGRQGVCCARPHRLD